MRLLTLARENGWAQTLTRVARSAIFRVRDSLTARHLRTTGFRVGAHPRLLGLAHMRIGKNFSGGDALWIEAVTQYAGQEFQPRLTLGDNINVSDRVHIGCLREVSIGSGTLIGSNVLISDHAHGVYRGQGQTGPESSPTLRPLSSAGPVRIGRNVWLGDGVCVLAGAEIGDGAVIGANSVVNGVIAPATLAAGAPARTIRRWDEASQEWQKAEIRDEG